MIIHRIKTDVKHYQWIAPNITEDLMYNYLVFDGLSKTKSWNAIEWYILDSNQRSGNFFNINSGVLAFDSAVFNSDLFSILEMAGEILPIKIEDKSLYALNVMETINMLDQEKSTFDYYDDGSKGRILKYKFHNRIPTSPIFKIPETLQGEILTYSKVKDKQDEFYYLYKKLEFTGLLFEELYSS
ncbi:hypothetical protein KHS38_20210 [Mucilaginibacter sp. Bleaf8]|uniref:hypothetical protein n=1 Tax=Mucilaginibacter sp. Bleaf8 TaxID=2834430 RepID=UPI001BD12843|nr:hypothetical protein [Mucilaginibacter sp. Bleaf8]MBS7566740.1 hypothetical protein [Mucilaginibacter sp. Bleaf8]